MQIYLEYYFISYSMKPFWKKHFNILLMIILCGHHSMFTFSCSLDVKHQSINQSYIFLSRGKHVKLHSTLLKCLLINIYHKMLLCEKRKHLINLFLSFRNIGWNYFIVDNIESINKHGVFSNFEKKPCFIMSKLQQGFI